MLEPEVIVAREENDLGRVRQAVRAATEHMGYSVLDRTRIGTAASELARNMICHGGGGEVRLRELARSGRRGLCLVFEDRGPGISDLETAMVDGFTTRDGLGLGLGGSRRLMDELEIESSPGKGTRVTVVKWI